MSGLKLSRNGGTKMRWLPGLLTARELCDITISLDADLQDDIEVLDQFVEEYHKGAADRLRCAQRQGYGHGFQQLHRHGFTA